MREVKFRAWDKQYNNMNYKILIGNVHDTDERYTAHCMWIEPKNVDYKCEPHWSHFDESSNIEIMQYTGLKDKNGKEIYEGDIVIHYEIPSKPFDVKQEIFFSDGMFCVGKIGETETPLYLETNTMYRGENVNLVEVIGNIYENPELLKNAR